MSSTNSHIHNARLSYDKGQLLENEADANPYLQLDSWLNDAITAQLQEPYAMNLSTINTQGYPSVRVVLMRKIIPNVGIVFFTNYNSNKGIAIAQNPKVSVNFFWQALERQVRALGVIEKLSAEESDAYFTSRPHESQVGAIVSNQSQPIASRAELDANYAAAVAHYENTVPSRPMHWGGYLIKINEFEFWQGRRGRMHDRLTYTQQHDNWQIVRLQP